MRNGAGNQSSKTTGPGVPPEFREQIFNPFFTSKKEGVGLGLSIVAKIVDAHHGWIKLEMRTWPRRALPRFPARANHEAGHRTEPGGRRPPPQIFVHEQDGRHGLHLMDFAG